MDEIVMAGHELRKLFDDLENTFKELDRIESIEGFKLSNKYEISGYTIDTVRKICYITIHLLASMKFSPSNIE